MCWIPDCLIDTRVMTQKWSETAAAAISSYFTPFKCICREYNKFCLESDSREREGTECSGQRTTFLLLRPPAFRILPFKVRPLSVSLYPHASFIPLSLRGSLGAPESPFYKLPPATHAITSAGYFRAGSFPRSVKRKSSWRPFILHTKTERWRARHESSTAPILEKGKLWIGMGVDDVISDLELHHHVCRMYLIATWHCEELQPLSLDCQSSTRTEEPWLCS